jgi:glycosyltransferase involved in cell wall biosynthesis
MAVQNSELREVPISAGISFHNGEQWFRRSIESVLSQSLMPKELIILDDGTNPGLSDFLEKLSFPFYESSIIKVDVNPMLDISEKYNKIIELARQPWIQIIDQDDYLYPNFYRFIQSYLAGDPSVIASGVRSNIKLMSVLGRCVSFFVKDGKSLNKRWPILGSITTRSGLIYNSEICKSNLFSFPTLNGSDIIHLDNMRKRGELIFVPSALVHYEVHGNSFSRSKRRSVTPGGFLYVCDSQIRFLISRILR